MDIAVIKQYINDIIKGTEIFLVNIMFNPLKRITVYIDCENGITINECAKISRKLKEIAGESLDDYDLEISSPGLGDPLLLPQQYKKNIGRNVEILLISGEKITGLLKAMKEECIYIDEEKLIKEEGKKKKQLKVFNHTINLKDIKETKVIVSFK
jgi:ribosome maturation factor RimP